MAIRLVGIRFSRVDVFNNKFLFNKTGAVVGVNQWQGASGISTGTNAEVRFFGNLFNANSIYGPLLHLFALPRMRFVNNSVINNSFYGHIDANNNGSPDSDTQYDGYFIYGVDTSAFGDIGSRQVEIHNNLFYGSGQLGRGLLADVASGLRIGCNAIGAGAPVRNNWFYPFIGVSSATDLLAGECNASGKITDFIDESVSAASFFGTTANAVDPFRLRPTDPHHQPKEAVSIPVMIKQ